MVDRDPAVGGYPVSGAALAAGDLHVTSRNLGPARRAVIDAVTLQREGVSKIPTGEGAWGMAATGDGVYFGMFGARGQANLYRTAAGGGLQAVAALDADYLWALAADTARRVYGVMSPPGVFVYDPASGLASLLPAIDAGAGDRPRSIVTADRRLVVGGDRAGKAFLVATGLDGTGRVSVLPPGLAGDEQVYTLAALPDGRVVAGTVGAGRGAPAIAVINLANPAAAAIARVPREVTIDAVAAIGGIAFATARPSGALYRFDPLAGALWRVAVPVPGSETRGLFPLGDRLIGASATGEVWNFHSTSFALSVAGPIVLDGDPEGQLVQSIAAGASHVYVGGNFVAARHRIANPSVTLATVPGEPKHGIVLRGRPWVRGTGEVAYLAMYPTAEVWAWRSAASAPARLAALPTDLLRPVAITAAPELGALVVTATDDRGGAGVCLVDPVTARVSTLRNPFGGGQIAAGAAADVTTLYVGGSGAAPSLVAIDGVGMRVQWRLDGVTGDGFLLGLAQVGRRLVALSTGGHAAIVDLDQRRVLARRQIAASTGRLVAARGALFTATPDAVLRLNPATLATTPVASGLQSRFWAWPSLSASPDGTLWAVRARALAQLPPT